MKTKRRVTGAPERAAESMGLVRLLLSNLRKSCLGLIFRPKTKGNKKSNENASLPSSTVLARQFICEWKRRKSTHQLRQHMDEQLLQLKVLEESFESSEQAQDISEQTMQSVQTVIKDYKTILEGLFEDVGRNLVRFEDEYHEMSKRFMPMVASHEGSASGFKLPPDSEIALQRQRYFTVVERAVEQCKLKCAEIHTAAFHTAALTDDMASFQNSNKCARRLENASFVDVHTDTFHHANPSTSVSASPIQTRNGSEEGGAVISNYPPAALPPAYFGESGHGPVTASASDLPPPGEFTSLLTSDASAATQNSICGDSKMIKKKKNWAKVKFSDQQNAILEDYFIKHIQEPYPNAEKISELAKETGLTYAQVKNKMVNLRSRHWQPFLDMVNSSRANNTAVTCGQAEITQGVLSTDPEQPAGSSPLFQEEASDTPADIKEDGQGGMNAEELDEECLINFSESELQEISRISALLGF
ncbi:hypothetical protein CYMTET_42988 [Cymbomonas tetramitiformis]|uniref:Homeobox domain-containing protein n=1 Tax=Cymbomonas tetramitiformis TaxID=36881 RepID=A0AAE0C338_9CHLO|nr:hypothetical protein CYMTET_42988 [Cymbomonas tetramitiformis]